LFEVEQLGAGLFGAMPMNVTDYVVVPFDRNEEGDLTAGAAQEATGALSAERGARALALEHAGAGARAPAIPRQANFRPR